MATATETSLSSLERAFARKPLSRSARRAVTRSGALKSTGHGPRDGRAGRAPSADTLLALTLLLGLLLNLSAFVDPTLLFEDTGSETWRAPGVSEAILALVPLLSCLALLGIGAYCRAEERKPRDHG